MDELEGQEDDDQIQRPSVKELVARIQSQTTPNDSHTGNNSESSDDEDGPLRMSKKKGPMGDSNLVPVPLPNYENFPADVPRSRSGVYSPTIVNTALIDSNSRYVEPIVKIQEYNQPSTSKYPVDPYGDYYDQDLVNPAKYYEHSLNSRLAKLRVLDSAKSYDNKGVEGSSKAIVDTNYPSVNVNTQDNADRDTNNDSGYSTKVYGSSKGNSPSLSGQIDGECLGASSLV